ncbi:hypothetical protein ISN45_Aa01g016450 [Arabidopsis thaliana x Arabidopsis arenosa]|uniref:Ubiquitin-like protease family profile domain-containing protein n=1 Tax=Arabidopsis thaliana x Arabidopsis arenosa TaxID=1240361 RepID=A0A8T2BZE5_9BRAS|nr:hypothetical protein ISN45_Aa01g016450 [Arabidopsis thaliana x Arabidopsis arenosa]
MESDEDSQGLIEYRPCLNPRRGERDSGENIKIVPELLPERLFATDRYPVKGRINSYSKPEYLLDIVDVLEGTKELQYLQDCPLGSLFELPIRKCSLSGKLVHNILCRSLVTAKEHEFWFVFGGHPFRFSLREFALVTGLPCFPYPAAEDIQKAQNSSNNSESFWKTLFGKKNVVTIDDIVRSLKVDSRKPLKAQMPGWKKLRLALIVIVEGILICDSQPVRASTEVVEMVRHLDTFFSYPWGRESFNLTMRMVKVGSRVETVEHLVAKMKQSHVATHGFILALQLHILHCIPLLETYLPDSDDEQTFTDRSVFQLAKLKSFHNSNILEAENNPELEVYAILETDQPIDESLYAWEDEVVDPGVEYVMSLIEKGVTIGKEVWHGGHDSLPLMSIPAPKIVKKEKKVKIPKKSVRKEEVVEDEEEDCNNGDDDVVGEEAKAGGLDAKFLAILERKLKDQKKEILSTVDQKILTLKAEILGKQERGGGRQFGNVGIKKCGGKKYDKAEGKKIQACLTRKREGIRFKKKKEVIEDNSQVDVDDYFGVNQVLENLKDDKGGQSVAADEDKNEDEPILKAGVENVFQTVNETELQDDTSFYKEVSAMEYEGGNCGGEKMDEDDAVEKSDDDDVDNQGVDEKDKGTSGSTDGDETDGEDGDEIYGVSEEKEDDNNPVQGSVDINTEHVAHVFIENDEQTVDKSGAEVTVDKMKTTSGEEKEDKEDVDIIAEVIKPLSTENTEHTVDNSGFEERVEKTIISAEEKSTDADEGVDVTNSTCDEGKEKPATEEEEEAVDKTDSEKSMETVEERGVNNTSKEEEKNEDQSDEEEDAKEMDIIEEKGECVDDQNKGRRGIKRHEDANNEYLPSKRAKKAPSRYGATPDNKPQTGGGGDIMTPKHWVDTPEMEAMLSLVWRKLGDSFNDSRIAVLDTWFISMLCNEYPRFKKWNKGVAFKWNSVCKNYVRGHVPSRTGKMMWFEDVDTVYLPMNWRKGHWVCLVVQLKEGRIEILDPLLSGNDLKKVKRFMAPVVEMLPCLIRDEITSPTEYPRPETFTYERAVAISQNDRTGDCGPLAVKFIELHGQGLGLDGITDAMVDNFRLNYAMDVYEEFVGREGRDAAYDPVVLKETDIDELLFTPARINEQSPYRQFFLKCLRARNPSALYIEGLRLGCQGGPIDRAILLLDGASRHLKYAIFALALFYICSGNQAASDRALAPLCRSHPNQPLYTCGEGGEAEQICNMIFMQINSMVPAETGRFVKTWSYKPIPECVARVCDDDCDCFFHCSMELSCNKCFFYWKSMKLCEIC